MHARTIRFTIITLAVFLAAQAAARAGTYSKKRLAKRVEQSRDFIDEIMMAPDTAIPQSLLRDCKGIIILRQYKAGFIIGIKGGHGVVLVKDEKGQYSPPAFVGTGEGSIGWQIGGQAVDAIILIMNKDGLDMLLKTKFKIGADASVAAGPLGRNADAKIGVGTALLSYSRSKGLFAGASLEGGVMLSQKGANHTYYGNEELSPRDILFRHEVKAVPDEAARLMAALKKYETAPLPEKK